MKPLKSSCLGTFLLVSQARMELPPLLNSAQKPAKLFPCWRNSGYPFSTETFWLDKRTQEFLWPCSVWQWKSQRGHPLYTTFPFIFKITPGFLNSWLPDSVLVYVSVSFISVFRITTLSAARQKGSPLEVKALLFGKLHTPQGNPTKERGTRPDFIHFNHVQNTRKHLSCQMEETKQISNYPPLLLLVSSQEKIRVTDGVGDPGACLYTHILSVKESPCPTGSCLLLFSHQGKFSFLN